MPPEVEQALEAMEGAVITRSTVANGKATLIAVSEQATFALTVEGCDWNDERCSKCSCDKSKVSIRVAQVS